MKTIILMLLVMSTSAWAGKCRLAGTVGGGFNCYRIVTTLAVDTAEGCEAFAKSTKDSNFFNLIRKKDKEILIYTKFSFKERGSKKVHGNIIFDDNVTCN